MENVKNAANNKLLNSMTNPLIRKLNKVREQSEDHVTLTGVANKSLYFLATVMLGVLFAWLLNRINPITVVLEGQVISVSLSALIVLLISILFFILTPLLAFLIRASIPVTGTLYCFSTGYLFSFIGYLDKAYAGPINLALCLTVAVVAALGFLYGKRIVKVTQRMRTIVSTFFVASLVSGLFMLIAYFIPGLRDAVDFIADNPLISIGGSVLYIIIAALFLLIDFDSIERAIANQLPKKYEWLGAFSLAFSVIWLFLKILSLIMKVKDNNK